MPSSDEATVNRFLIRSGCYPRHENRGKWDSEGLERMEVLILGATGMVGSEVLVQCLANDKIQNVLTAGRRMSGIQHPKLKEIEHSNFLEFSALEAELSQVNICFYCLGVYQSQVSKEEFWEITVDYLRAMISTFERTNKNVRFCLFSAQGASTSERSPIRFAKAKGRAENILLASELSEKYIFRPGLIVPGPQSKECHLTCKTARTPIPPHSSDRNRRAGTRESDD